MSFDPELWLQVADVCCINIPRVDTEALLRTAVNRAYYAALLSVRKRIEEVHGPGSVPSAGTHEAIFKDIHDELLKLRTARNGADYNLAAAPLVHRTAVSQISRSRWLIRNRINAVRDEEYRRLKVPTKLAEKQESRGPGTCAMPGPLASSVLYHRPLASDHPRRLRCPSLPPPTASWPTSWW